MNQKLWFLCFRGIHNSLPSFWVKLCYSLIKINHIADSLLKDAAVTLGVNLHLCLLSLWFPYCFMKFRVIYFIWTPKFSNWHAICLRSKERIGIWHLGTTQSKGCQICYTYVDSCGKRGDINSKKDLAQIQEVRCSRNDMMDTVSIPNWWINGATPLGCPIFFKQK